ncbi:uncharacterized protein ACBT57_023927 [Dama dama]
MGRSRDKEGYREVNVPSSSPVPEILCLLSVLSELSSDVYLSVTSSLSRPQVLSTPEAHHGQLPVSSPRPSTQTTALPLPVTHPGEVSSAARILYSDFHNMHNK